MSQKLPSYTAPGSSTELRPDTTQTYDQVGQLTTVTDPLGEITTYLYDQLGRTARVTAPDGGVTKYSYDLVGNPLSVTDPTGAVNASTYDYLGRTRTTSSVVRQTSGIHTTNYEYAQGGWPEKVISPSLVTITTTYNAVGEPLTVKDGANNVTKYSYDGDGRRHQVQLRR